MPELPEVESKLLYLRKTALGQVIDRVIVHEPRLIKTHAPQQFARRLKGRRLAEAVRRGKYLVISLDDERSLLLHFTMGGDLHYYDRPEEAPRFTRIEFLLENGKRLGFTCPRNICRVMLVDSTDEVGGLREMGPEPLSDEFDFAQLKSIIQSSHSRVIKTLLMDQRRIAGIGNIYADEILFKAGILPFRPAASLTSDEIKRLYRSIRQILKSALNTAGEEVFPPDFLISLDERGATCPKCGGPIEKMRIGGRTTRFCRHCQN